MLPPTSRKVRFIWAAAAVPRFPGLRAPQVLKRKQEDGYGTVRAIDPKDG